MVSFSALKSTIQPSSSTIFICFCIFFQNQNMKIYKVPRWTGPGKRAGPEGPGPLARGPGPARLPGPVHRGEPKILEVVQVFFLKNAPPENHEKTTFRAFLETKGPRDPPWVQERQILFRIQDSLNEISVRPNGTPVMPVLRSRSTVKKTVRKKTWSGG